MYPKGGMHIKTRAHLYGQEAAELLRIISMYPGLTTKQLYKFYPDREDVVKSLLSHFLRQGRILYEESCSGYFSAQAPLSKSRELINAVWILLDFIDRTDYHSVSDFPVQLTFFADGELYEIVSIPLGQEALITHILEKQKAADSKRLLVVDKPQQIPALNISCAAGYCTVSPEGCIHYYQKQ